MKTQRIKTLLLFLSMIPFIGIYAQSIYYVSPHASSGGDGSQSAPFHSIHEAVEKGKNPGEIMRLRGFHPLRQAFPNLSARITES